MAHHAVFPLRVNAGGIILSMGSWASSGLSTRTLLTDFSRDTRDSPGFMDSSGPSISTALSAVSTGNSGA